jgi:hypothetical protein
MPLDGYPARLAHERQDQQARQGKLHGITKLGKADYHIRVPLGWLGFVSAEEAVPTYQIDSIIPLIEISPTCT